MIIVTPTVAPTVTATAEPSATPTATATPPPTSILLNGSAFQGAIVTNETILAYSVDPTDGSNLAFLGATTADNTGNFNLTISPVPTGPMRVIADGGNLTSAMDGTTIPAPGDLDTLFLTATGSIANISINPLSDFVDSLTTGNLRTPGTAFATAFNSALAKIESDYGLKTNPAQLTPDYTAATVGTDAGNLGLILGAMINEDQFLCPGGSGSLVNALSSDIGDGAFDGLSFGTPISYCGGLLFGAEGLSYFQDALSGLWQFEEVTRAFAFGATGNLLTANGLANVALNGKQVYPLAPLASINTALRNAAPIPQNSFALPAQTATMNTARGFASAALLPTGQVLIAGGGSIGGIVSSVELYDPVSNSFAPPAATPSMNVARDNSTATLLPNGLVLIAAGFGGTGAGSYLSSTELYNPLTNTFAAPAATATMNTARSGATATLLPNGKVLIAGGVSPTGAQASTELYNPSTNSFNTVANTAKMNVGRTNTTAILLPNGKVLIAGGEDAKGNSLASTELYDPATNTFAAAAATAKMNVARASATATLLPNGKVLIAGGFGSTVNIGSTELYDPATNTFAPPAATASMNIARAFAVASLLPNGRVLIAGGFDVNFNLTNSTDLYDPVTNTFAHPAATASLNMDHIFATITPLPNGKVLIAGGDDPIDNSTDLYIP